MAGVIRRENVKFMKKIFLKREGNGAGQAVDACSRPKDVVAAVQLKHAAFVWLTMYGLPVTLCDMVLTSLGLSKSACLMDYPMAGTDGWRGWAVFCKLL
jgi:hypothetical protein